MTRSPTRLLGVLVVLGFQSFGCASAPPTPPPLVPEPEGPITVVREDDADVPRSIRRLLAEEHAKVAEMENLVSIVGDARGRARIHGELEDQRAELDRIENALPSADSDGLDALWVRIQRLHTRTELLHESLLTAAR